MYDEAEEGATHVENRKSRCQKFDDFEDVQQTGLISSVLTSKIHFVSPNNQQKNCLAAMRCSLSNKAQP